MIAFQITNTKDFMKKLLSSEIFDIFLLEEASINTYNTFSIDGHIQKDFYPKEELPIYNLSLWKNMKPLCFQLIKGRQTPLNFKFVLHLIPECYKDFFKNQTETLSINQVNAFILNIRYDGSFVTIITGTNYQTFSLDKEADHIWDQSVRNFFSSHEIAYEERG